MGSLSKFLKLEDCSVLVHPNETCIQAFNKNLRNYILSNAKLFAPIVMMPMLLKLNSLNLPKIRKNLRFFIECVFYGYLIGLGCTTNMCIFGNIFKQVYTQSIFAAGFCAGALPICYTNVKITRLYVITVFEVLLEIWFNSEKDIVSRAINKSKLLQTFIFMLNSSLILHEQSIGNYPVFWFIKPLRTAGSEENLNKSLNESNAGQCRHSGNCTKFFFNGLKFYGSIGLGITLFKGIISASSKTSNGLGGFCKATFKSLNFSTAKFLLFYIGIYRGSYCLLNNYCSNINDKLPVHRIASFLGGLSYAFYPHKIFIAYALLLSTEILWKKFKYNKRNSESKLDKILLKYPWDRIFFPFGLGMALHLFMFHRQIKSSLCRRFINGNTNFRAEAISRRFEHFLKSQQFM